MASNSYPIFKQLPALALSPNGYNPNKMSEAQFKALKETMIKDGFLGIVLVNKTAEGYIIVDGEHRWKAALEIGLDEIPCLVIEIAEDKAKALTVKLNQIHGDWDAEELINLLQDIPDPLEELGFSNYEYNEELKRLLMGDNAEKIIEKIESQKAKSASFDPSRTNKYIGFVLSPQQQELLEDALTISVKESNNPLTSRSLALKIILRAYVQKHTKVASVVQYIRT